MPFNFELPSFSQGFMRAKQDAYESKIRDMALRRDQALEQDALWRQEAAAYLAPINQHRTEAVSGGMSTADYFTAQMNALRNDEGFKRKSPDVQRYILQMMTDSATVEANRAAQNKDWTTANAVLQAVGQQPRVTQRQMTLDKGDPLEIIRQLNQEGHQVTLSEDNKFVIDPSGSKVPVALFVAEMRKTGTPVSGYAVAQQWGLDAADRELQQRLLRMQLAEYEKALKGAEYVPASDAGLQTVVRRPEDPQPGVQSVGESEQPSYLARLLQNSGLGHMLAQQASAFDTYAASSPQLPHIAVGTTPPSQPPSAAMQSVIQAQQAQTSQPALSQTPREQELAQIASIVDLVELQRRARELDDPKYAQHFRWGGGVGFPKPSDPASAAVYTARAAEDLQALQQRFNALQQAEVLALQNKIRSKEQAAQSIISEVNDSAFQSRASTEELRAKLEQERLVQSAIYQLTKQLQDLRSKRLR